MRLTSTRGQAEVVGKIYEPLADEYREIQTVQAGDVAICSGLKVNHHSFFNITHRLTTHLAHDYRRSTSY